MVFAIRHSHEHGMRIIDQIKWSVKVHVSKNEQLILDERDVEVDVQIRPLSSDNETPVVVLNVTNVAQDIDSSDIDSHDLDIKVHVLAQSPTKELEWVCFLSANDHNTAAFDTNTSSSRSLRMHCSDVFCVATSMYNHLPRTWTGVVISTASINLEHAFNAEY